MGKQKIYLAGGFKSDWANEVKKCSNNFQWINPKEKEFNNGERIVMKYKKKNVLLKEKHLSVLNFILTQNQYFGVWFPLAPNVLQLNEVAD